MKRQRYIGLFIIFTILTGLLAGFTYLHTLPKIKLGLDLQGGFEVLYKVESLSTDESVDEDILTSTISALNNRINAIGVSEPNIQAEGSDRIRVQLAGVEDQTQARELLSTEANLTFRDVDDRVMLDGSDIKSSKLSFDERNQPIVSLTLNDEEKFYEVTKELSSRAYPDNLLVIWLDHQEGQTFEGEMQKSEKNRGFLSAPQVHTPLSGENVVIEGDFTIEEAKVLAELIKAGALPVKLTELYSQSIGAQFGLNALETTSIAGVIGITLIFFFMIAYYRLPGFVAVITLSIYISLILTVFDWMNAVLTLPGIAALILGVGMAVDANIITYERIKDELRHGNSLAESFEAGSKRAFITILDANLTTILAAGVLFYFGTSAVKGFATMLMVSILVSFLTAVLGSRLLLGTLVKSRMFDGKLSWFGTAHSTREKSVARFKFNFVENRKKFFAITLSALIIGVFASSILGWNLGIDFTSGTRIEVTSNTAINLEKLEEEFSELGYEPTITIAGKNNNMGVATLKGDLSAKQIGEWKEYFQEKYGHDPNINVVSPLVGQELAKNALLAVAIAAIGIVLYLTMRYEFAFAITAVIALLHDVLFMFLSFSVLQVEINLYFIAAVLTIIGYSINDTIVTFDRINEHLKRQEIIENKATLKEIVNRSLLETFTRSINTVLTVLFTVVCLYLFGSEAISGFSLALLIGLILGTYSSLFIASQLWYELKVRRLKKGPIMIKDDKEEYGDEPVV
ncbi:SecD/SecF fusion protein [Bacillus tianshenii]|uniref:Multifunctional fusion protein n=1 Tax=Sutcliffiella tianshenii TaxID=1463404 RepID=A0ABS2P380_9BACI|nr:protein translocase subunit SecD [Bacillus tianshenii]MBM7620870.1 SecD/SecF fusion protein [Bacillus tianshenii]